MLNRTKSLPHAMELGRRQGATAALQLHLQEREAELTVLLKGLKRFIVRYAQELTPLYKELEDLEQQLGKALQVLMQAQGTEFDAAPETGFGLPDFGALPPPDPEIKPPAALPARPTVRQLYQRAAMRLHPDRANSEIERGILNKAMTQVNLAYVQGDRFTIERLLVQSGDDPVRVSGDNTLVRLHWARQREQQLRQREQHVMSRLTELRSNPMHKLWVAVSHAEALGLDPLGVMAERLRMQVLERRQELRAALGNRSGGDHLT